MRYFIFLFSFIIVFSCTSNDTSTTKATKSTTIKGGISNYTHPFDIYKMNVPNIWKKEFNDKTETITLTNPPIDGRAFDEKITIVTRRGPLFYDKDKKEMISKKVELTPVVGEYLKAIAKSKGFKLLEQPTEGDLKGNKKMKIVFELENEDGVPLKTQTDLINNGDLALLVHYTAAKETFDKTFPTYQNILKSIQF